ncbi:zinc finger CCCH domain-containing protein 16 [Benincasa hispida]|uniref:zinc finger CCCH domain-containing protein 16 n=1 Tax=Benincasa hispida TaxID=102211 RepID=UPI0018FF8DEC|nr:zinc finger CCCH domain-containing protein 16 [Benincasa hispida]
MHYKKAPCRDFQRGSCQYGERCKFLHGTQQPQKSSSFGFGVQTSSQQQQQQQKPNPFGFGVPSTGQSKAAADFGSKQNQYKPFENKWIRSSTPTAMGNAQSRKPDNHLPSANHKCTDGESCKRQIAEDFQNERPLWKLTCYGHNKNEPCDIVGDVSYEELRAIAYDEAKRGISLQSIVERERNLLNSKLAEFEALLHKPYVKPANRAPGNQSSFSGTNSLSNLPNSILGAFGSQLPSQTFGNSTLSGFNNSGITNAESNLSSPAMLTNFPTTSANSGADGQIVPNAQLVNKLQQENSSVDVSIWMKEKWVPGEIPEVAPPDSLVQ